MTIYTDVLIIGTGIAGLYCALNLRKDLNITLISKSSAQECNSYLAQGGISVAKGKEDLPLFVEDTLKAGDYKNNKLAVEVLVNESIGAIDGLIKFNVPFDRDDEGNLLYTKEGAHCTNRIVHCKDRTGEEIHSALFKEILKRNNITVLENTFFIDFITKENSCLGITAIKDNNALNILAKAVVLCTGGIGGIFINSTNYKSISGDGIAIALRRGVKIKNLNYIQFHPTSLYDNSSSARKFLISEAVRGEGGKLLNIFGERFVDELLPRDKVTAAIFNELKNTDSKFVYLDVTFIDKNFLIKRFPTIYNECLKRGIDISKDLIPVTPAQHYLMGGIEVDLNSKTSMKNLYACGEASCTGVHGANRLASNSLLEGLVFAKRAAIDINKNIEYNSIQSTEFIFAPEGNINFYQEFYKSILVQEICKIRGDIIDELVPIRIIY
ncbi:L-aspartate oxidase [Clostridium polyendosporum]|uniref:L-aspartate oxidase n=1 Tax=Clostridium polyendosporum TaxID=69208 RepID=A0A919S2K8_9CLOT|nr:L-aspartate oxidase [Clostridium polyendosporum]GIM29438.1 L-aspartate oxidase [Clostridium polyendosporum]